MTTWGDITKSTDIDTFLLKEDTFHLLLETGGKMVLTYGVNYGDIAKSSTVWTNINKS